MMHSWIVQKKQTDKIIDYYNYTMQKQIVKITQWLVIIKDLKLHVYMIMLLMLYITFTDIFLIITSLKVLYLEPEIGWDSEIDYH